ncbi:MAG: glycine C-acetyltransferase [Lentisphaerae bacterium RIFOXYA12_64_32]|nr:MAG: glycine C-acetyltransferase [Lentisphaerae bacterium RIFOXYA12_64_32]
MTDTVGVEVQKQLDEIRAAGLYKNERVIASPQGPEIRLADGRTVLNLCANNYLGLSSHPAVIAAAHKALDEWGYGLSSVRFICGTQQLHKDLECKVSQFLGTDDTILFAACFDANGGVFEPFLDKECAVISDALNHASIIDGIRLTKAQRFVYEHNNLAELEKRLQETANAKRRLVATDGVFSMNGDVADLAGVCALADKYKALIMVDDSHATGFVGKTGRGTHEACGVMGKIDLITTTFGKALGGASGGCVSGRKELIEFLRQRSRPYLFSNTLAPPIAGATIAVLDLLSKSTALRDKLEANTLFFRREMTAAGFNIPTGTHPIAPLMLYDEKLAHAMADAMLAEGIYVIGFSYPVVPKGQARIRVQLSAAHERHHLEKAIAAFIKVGKALGVIKG